ncbi:DUF4845 domain-containing protein [Massilia sp. Dwa41.01b]|uniref:DUF4845 domain-containing protein n=1 Tax=unclassified Massilia TaxID=2609279 RepID=UPI00160398DF|nr:MULTISPECIES: DUF4845 domain-containing protein [unclassified Massilia]QNA89516.1 DUF4845 domain-containing protein [Massilia sp. Dwa41.01b]QNB00415.1 DUF4845 domain-containing protein [Massilia sp. Se16.2.3]
MQQPKQVLFSRQRGISLTGLILVLAVLSAFAVVAIKIIPSYIEFRAVRDGIVRAKAAGGTVRDMQKTFDKYAEVNNVEAVRGQDVVITRDGDTPELSFAYEKRIPFTDRISIVIDYDGTTDPSGVVAAKAE